MEFIEYPKRVYLGETSKVVNSKEEEIEFLGVKEENKIDTNVEEVLKRKAGRPKKVEHIDKP